MTPGRHRAFVSLGSNLGDRSEFLRVARQGLAAVPVTAILAASHIYETAAQDLPDQPPFLNQVLGLETGLTPAQLFSECQALEQQAGRQRLVRFGPRTLDVDILLFQNAQSDDPALTLPHPRLWQRAFVLVPLAEIWPLAVGMPEVDVPALARQLADRQAVEPFAEAEE
ncbi:MAG: 2-amino-4-hydroxy-6-hydroxymethyldihydropteridine diphosphokinase [Thermoleophilia bacterium]|jgi:2-amino-4-hydroxy-6-hydroxymethyldihydropteridine diphosphokinase